MTERAVSEDNLRLFIVGPLVSLEVGQKCLL